MLLIKEGDSGSYVQMVQLALWRSGFLNQGVDGIFGGQTKSAVIAFQRAMGLTPDGIVGKNTFNALRPYLVGYTTYIIKSGDTLYNLANRFYSTVPLIENANPNLSLKNLQVSEKIIIPFAFNIVPTNIDYNSLLVQLICEGLVVRYPFINLSVVGRSVLNEPLPMITIGKGAKKVFFNATHHANEWITTPMLLSFAEEYAKAVTNADYLDDKNAEYLFDNTTAYFLPLVNPDGVDLINGAISKESEIYLDALMFANDYPFIPFPSGWKANISGVDLNLNYPALWEEAKKQKYDAGFISPAPRDFVGFAPLDQPESRAVYNLSLKENFDLTLSLHTQGEEIYWRFLNYMPNGGKELGEKMAAVSGYRLADPDEFSSYAGYKDWFIMTYLKPGYTIEAGRGSNPLPIKSFDNFYAPVKKILLEALAYFTRD